MTETVVEGLVWQALESMARGSKASTSLAVPGREGGDGGAISLPLLLVRGAADGTRVAILGGVHGDEYEGIAAAAAVWRDTDAAALRGDLAIVSVSNPPAFEAGTRVSSIDGLNLARTFPGRADGTATERIAHAIGTRVIKGAGFLMDLHSAGQHYAMPLLAGSYVGESDLGRRCEAAALAFGAPTYWAHPEVAPGRSLSVAMDEGIPNLYAECGGGGRVRPHEHAAYRDGVRRVLAHLGMLPADGVSPPPAPSLRLRGTGDLDTWIEVTRAGILKERVALLDRVTRGQVLGEVVDERGEVLQTIEAPWDGVVVMARRTARVRPGDGSYMIALPDDGGLGRTR